MRIANAILLLLLVLGSNVYALNVSQIYSGSGERCLQLTPSNITCPDGIPIVTSFALSSQSYPYYYYGNFTAYALRGENMSSPVNAYGEPCTVSSSSTSVCFVTIPPVPFTALNGTLNESLTIRLVSQLYPQVAYNYTFNVTINHYINATLIPIVGFYNSTLTEYTNMASAYGSVCGTYYICDAGISDALSTAKSYMGNATYAMNGYRAQEAYFNASMANRTLASILPQYNTFETNANKIINNILGGQEMILNASTSFSINEGVLNKCNSTEARALNASINSVKTYSIVNTLNSSALYLSAASGVQTNVAESIKRCQNQLYNLSGSSTPASTKPPQEKPTQISLSNAWYLALIPVLIILIYLILRSNEAKEIRKIREGSS